MRGAVALGVLAALAGVGLAASSGLLISRAALRPEVFLSLILLVTTVRALGLGRAALRYAERLAGHGAALAQGARARLALFDQLSRFGRDLLGHERAGDLLARGGSDLDARQFYTLRVTLPLWAFGGVALLLLALLAIFDPLLAALGVGPLLLGAGAVLVRAGLASRAAARQTWVEPVQAFFERHGWVDAALLLALIGLYRISDIVLGVISNVFYQDLGFSKPDIATAVKTFGVVVSIAGGFLGGLLALRLGVLRALWWGALLSALTNLAFVALALAGPQRPLLYAVVAADNLAAGFASAAFVAFLSSLTQVRFTAVQYAIFSSLMTLLPKALGGYSGAMVDALGYPGFFVLTAALGLPVLALVSGIARRVAQREQAHLASASPK